MVKYKRHNTVKYLIGVPHISRLGGKASDVHITNNCGLLEICCPGDTILADQECTIEQSVNMYCAKVILSFFTKGKPQLNNLT